MPIRIRRNEEGNCILFEGSANPAYFNACLSGQVNEFDADNVNVVNDIASAINGNTVYSYHLRESV